MQFDYAESNQCECRYFSRLHWYFRYRQKKRAQRLSVLCSNILLEGFHTHPLMCSGLLPFGKCWFIKGTIPQKRSLEQRRFRDQDLDIIVIPSQELQSGSAFLTSTGKSSGIDLWALLSLHYKKAQPLTKYKTCGKPEGSTAVGAGASPGEGEEGR